MKFPNVKGSNLEGREYKLPADFEGELNLLFIGFQRWHQSQVDSWMAAAQKLAQATPGLYYYELPTIYRGNPLFRFWLDTAMRMGIPDRQARAATITLYLDKPVFRESLGIDREDNISVLLVKRDGEVLWRSEGAYNEEKWVGLTKALDAE